MALKPIRILYQSFNQQAGLPDVRAQIYINEQPKAVGGSALPMVEYDTGNSKGFYYVVISGSQLAAWGAKADDWLEAKCDSASKSLPSGYREQIRNVSLDDLDIHLNTQDGALSGINGSLGTLGNNLTAANTNITAIRSKVDSPQVGLDYISQQLSGIQTSLSQNVVNNTAFSPSMPEGGIVKPVTGSMVYRIPMTVQQTETNAVIDPVNNTITVSLANVAGADRGNLLVGYANGSAKAVRDSTGNYHVDVNVDPTLAEEPLYFTFSLVVNGNQITRRTSTNVLSNVQSEGFALQASLLDAIATINKIVDYTNGTAGVNARAAATYDSVTDISRVVNGMDSLLTNTISAKITDIGAAVQTAVTNSTASLSNQNAMMTTQSQIIGALSAVTAQLTEIRNNQFTGGVAF